MVRIAHLSDPHFTSITHRLAHFRTKRWLGNYNYLLFRKRSYQTEHLWHIPELLSTLNVDAVCITGDFASTSLDEEFEEGKRFVDAFTQRGMKTFYLPGNHDCYTRQVEEERRFYHYFPSTSLREKRVECKPIVPGWWYIGLDCAVAAPLFCSYGIFDKETEYELIRILAQIPQGDRVIMANHFPLFPSGRSLHDLKRADALKNILCIFPKVAVYLHGHDHKHDICLGPPLTINSGSCAHRPNGIFYILEITEDSCLAEHFIYKQDAEGTFSWVMDKQQTYPLRYS